MGAQNIHHVQSTLAVPCMADVCFSDSKEIYLQCILGLSHMSCGSLSLEAHSCFTV